MTQPWAP